MIARVLEDSDSRKFKNLRVFGIYGKYEDYSRRFISNNICRALSGLKILINKDMMFDFVSVNDLSNLLINHFDTLYTFDKVSYNFCSKEPKYLSDIARILCHELNQDDFVIKDSSGLNPEYSGDPSEILSLLQDFDYIDLEQGIGELINYYQLLFRDKLIQSEFALSEQNK